MEATIASAAEGDPGAWRVLVEAYSARVFGLVLRQCNDRELAEEITQATFVRVVEGLPAYKEKGKFEPWLFRIAMNRLRDEMRRRKRQARGQGGQDQASDPTEQVRDTNRSAGSSRGSTSPDRIVGREPSSPDNPLEALDKEEQVEQLRQAIGQLGEADQQILHLRHTAGLSFPEIAQTLDQPLGTVLARGHRALGKLRKLMMGDDEE